MPQKPVAFHRHNHSHCVSSALAEAQELCTERGARLTPLRRQVLELVWRSHRPLGAYALMDLLAEESTRRVAPPTVYRALDFLLEQGLIHRINGLNAFVGCPTPNERHQSHFLLCRSCGVAKEMESNDLSTVIRKTAEVDGFLVESDSLEVNGLCPSCRSSDGA
ncbi:Fur family transcriptional regulator [Marinimicrobium sp. ABcell2]|uniref:Fur family transcriptional regulator n=1 Tax=Marinimicrobium sp. ABcell2 TaxID=3069751 RepID=UPI0027B4554C|nr:Fur family transcriptional regulator [Marinimicrobium sp. ABcell2]MDQ2076230.1 Fur family transcriptional regulator [Marinimicrobium sp. ABcell2]